MDIEDLFRAWHRLGGAVLLADTPPSSDPPAPEEIIAESTAQCRHSGRLTWVTLDWLERSSATIDAALLIELTRARGDLAVLGVLSDAAHEHTGDPVFLRIMEACAPNPTPELFFFRVAASPLAARLAKQNPLPVFARWNFICNELIHLSEKQPLGG